MDQTPPRLAIEEVPESRTLLLKGDVDCHTAQALDTEVTSLGMSGDVTLDLSSVAFVDSSGLRVLIAAHEGLAEAGVRLILRAPSQAVERLIEITGLQDHLHFED